MKNFVDLSERELLAVAISQEEEDSRLYTDFADGLVTDFPASAQMFAEMAVEENDHRHRLLDLYRQKFGDEIPLLRRQDIKGFVVRKLPWVGRPLSLNKMRAEAEKMEATARRFYIMAARRSQDASIRQLLGDLAAEERRHEQMAENLEDTLVPLSERDQEDATEKKLFLLQIVQPGLAGLMDGSVSTLAPLFAAAFATHQSHETFLVGLAAALGAGISMGFAEALSDDGAITGRGRAWLRGITCGCMTALGGLGHTLPYLLPDFWLATTLAGLVVMVELFVIAWIRKRFMDTPFLRAVFQVVVGGVLVFLTGIIIGSS
jgi:rubrerythrin